MSSNNNCEENIVNNAICEIKKQKNCCYRYIGGVTGPTGPTGPVGPQGTPGIGVTII